MKNVCALCFVLSLLALVSCNNETPVLAVTQAFPLDSVKAQIAASNEHYGAAFTNNDSAGFVANYTEDGCLFAPNMARICGRQGIGTFFRGGYDMGIRNIKLTTEEVTGGKEAVVETGKYEIMAQDGKVIDLGKYIVIWKEEDGVFKMHRDEWNSDLPIPATK